MNKYFLILGLLFAVGCSDEAVVKSESIKWVSAGTLVSVGSDTESTPHPGRLQSAILGETKLSRTRIKTTKGVYIVGDKIGLTQTGTPVSVGYESSDKYPDSPSYLTIEGERYKIVR